MRSGSGSWPPARFFVGANLPWVDYGCDLGASAWFPEGGLSARPDALERYGQALDRLAGDRVSVVRLFWLCDGRSGIRFDAAGVPLGVDDSLFADADAALDGAAARGIRLLPVLFDFHLCLAARLAGGVQLGGRAALVADPSMRERLLSRIVRPIAERYGQHPAVVAWDLFNEPEWCTRPFASAAAADAVPFAGMRECLGLMLECVRAFARQPVTVGLGRAAHLELVRGLGLDFYQVHWYEPFGWSTLTQPVSRLDLDRPVVLGEFPGNPAGATPGEVVSAARQAGYSGALIWSVLSPDGASGYTPGLAVDD